MEKSKRNSTMLIIITIAFFLVVVIGATYAYFTESRNVRNVINANVLTASKMYSFTATSTDNIEMNIAFNEMSKANVSTNVLKSDEATIDLSLSSPAEDVLTICTYDIVWIWDSDENNRYIYPDKALPFADNGKTYNYEFSTKIDEENETDLSKITPNDNTLTLKRGEMIKSYGTTPTTKKHNITINIYNLPVEQTNLFNKKFKAYVTINNLECNMEDFRKSNLKLATTYNGNAGVPTTVGPFANAECTGGTATYNQKYNQLEISGINADKASCDLIYTDRASTENLANKVKSLVGNGQVFAEKGYRYEGKTVDNYVWFNNELWRIIGVFDSNIHGLPGQELVKIIRADSLGAIIFDNSVKYGNNAWETSSLKKLLNGAYLNRENGDITAAEYCYQYYENSSQYVKGNCNYTEMGIGDDYKSMIKEVYWFTGGVRSYGKTGDIYTAERSSRTSTKSKIGIINASDYGYSAPSASCVRTTELSSYHFECANSSWLADQGNEWTILPHLTRSELVLCIEPQGHLNSDYAKNGNGFRPVLYLDSSVYTYAGNGTKTSPYIIGM